MKRILLPLFLFSLIGISSAADIIVPSEESYHVSYTDEFTFTLVVSSEDYNGRIVVEDRWTEPCSVCAKEPALYNRTASDLGIGINYEDEFYISERTAHDLKVSVKVDTADVYCGLIIFTPIDAGGSGILSRGTWITMDMRGISVSPVTSPTNKTALNITGFSSEKNLEIYLNQNPVGTVEITSGNNFTTAITLSEGDNEIVMKAVDSELRSNPIHITLDTIPPDAPIISPIPPPTVNKSMITIAGTSEAESIVRIFVNEIEKNNISVSGSGDFTLSNIGLDVGNNTITAVAVDRAGNPSNESVPVCMICIEHNKRIQLSADKTTTILQEGGSATCNITALVVDEGGTLMENTTVTINFSIVSGNAVLLTREVKTDGGRAATTVECSGAGDVTINAETSSLDIAGDSLTISFISSKATLSSENETNETTNASGSDDRSGGRNIPSILIYILLVIVVVVAGFLLYTKVIKKRKGQAGGADDGSSWMVSAMKKKGEDYLITIERDGKRKRIKLNEKLYKKLIKKRKMTFGKHTIMFKPKK